MSLYTEIMNMPDEEVADLNRKLAKRLQRQLALKATIAVVVVVAVDHIARKLDDRNSN